MLGDSYKDLEHEEVFDTLEEAILTSCPICGTELEWQLRILWDEFTELPAIYGKSFSCGETFSIVPVDGGYMTKVDNR